MKNTGLYLFFVFSMIGVLGYSTPYKNVHSSCENSTIDFKTRHGCVSFPDNGGGTFVCYDFTDSSSTSEYISDETNFKLGVSGTLLGLGLLVRYLYPDIDLDAKFRCVYIGFPDLKFLYVNTPDQVVFYQLVNDNRQELTREIFLDLTRSACKKTSYDTSLLEAELNTL